jgi:hypothetical protein
MRRRALIGLAVLILVALLTDVFVKHGQAQNVAFPYSTQVVNVLRYKNQSEAIPRTIILRTPQDGVYRVSAYATSRTIGTEANILDGAIV